MRWSGICFLMQCGVIVIISKIMAKYREQIGQQLKTYREQQGWSIEQVAEMVEVKPVTIEKIENGAFDVRLSLVSRVCEVLGCSLVIKE